MRNRALHRLLVDGVTVEYRDADGEHPRRAGAGDRLRRPGEQRLAGGQPVQRRREQAQRAGRMWCCSSTACRWRCWSSRTRPTRTPRSGPPSSSSRPTRPRCRSLFAPNALLVVSDGVEARVGTLGAGREWFKPWRTIAGETLADAHLPELQVVIEGLLRAAALPRPGARLHRVRGRRRPHRQEDGRLPPVPCGAGGGGRDAAGGGAAPRGRSAWPRTQGRYEAGRKPGGKPGDRRVGVVWHTQGSGKSLTMAFYAGRIIREPAMENPTLVVLTDRNDLDDQLFGTFSRCQDLLRQPPVQAESRAHLRELLARGGGRRGVHHHPQVLPRGEGRPAPDALRAAQHRGDRRRGAPQPVRLHRRLRAPHARRAAARLVHRLHRHADRAARTPTRARCSATTSASTTSSAPCRTAPRCRSTTRAGWPSSRSTRPSGRRSTRSSRRRPRARRSSARRSSRPSGRSSRPWSAPRSGWSWWPRTSSSTSRSGSRRWTARR